MKPVRLSEKVLHIRGGKRKGNVRNMIDLAKAIRYAEKFVSKNKARPVFNYIFIKDGEVISSDTYFVIKCEVGGKQEPQLINPKGTELLAEPENYPDVNKFFQTKGFKTNITFDSDTGLKESFKKLAVIFDTCKKLTTKEELHKVYMKIKGNKLLIFSGEGELIFFEYSVSEFEGEPICCTFNADHLSRICKVIADVNPSTVDMYFLNGSIMLIKMDSVQIFGCGINTGKANWLAQKAEKYCEVE